MTQPSGPNPVTSSFAAHVREFHRGLPNEEKQLLEEVFALAEAANQALSAEGDEARGYALVDYFLKIDFAKHKGEVGAGSAYKEQGVFKISPALQDYFAKPDGTL
jgi:hypothetical protein